MPELPEVEIERRNLQRWFRKRRVVSAEAENSRTFRGADRKAFESLRGRLLDASRKGKYLLLSFEGGRGLLAHLGMTGKFVRRSAQTREPYSRARFFLDNQQVVHFRDVRLLGRMEPVEASRLWQLPPIRLLGRDPLTDGLTPAQLKEALVRSRQAIKVALMDQSRLAGLGNIHAAEALFRARIHPARKPSSLKTPEWSKLCSSILATIRFALEEEDSEEVHYVEEPGTENPFLVYGRAGEPCRRCRTPIQSFVQAGRTTHFCPKCQPRRRVG